MSFGDGLKQHLPAPVTRAVRAGKREAKGLLLVPPVTRSAMAGAPVSMRWKRDAIWTQSRLVRAHSNEPCRARVGDFELKSFSSDQLAFLHREIFIELSYYFRASRPDPLIVDGGSNIGVSVAFFKTLYPGARVLAFEPAERAYGLLERNVGAVPGVELHRVALGRENGIVSFYEREDEPASLMQSTRPERLRTDRTASVEQRQLSGFIAGDVDLVKLDVEGAEDGILEDLAESGAIERVQQLIVEYHHQLDPDRDSVGAFLERLRGLGFSYQLSAEDPPRLRSTLTPRAQDVMVHAFRR